MLVEVAAGFCLLCLVQRADMLRLAMDQTIGGSALLVLLSLNAFAHRPKVDQFSHRVPLVASYRISPILNCTFIRRVEPLFSAPDECT